MSPAQNDRLNTSSKYVSAIITIESVTILKLFLMMLRKMAQGLLKLFTTSLMSVRKMYRFVRSQPRNIGVAHWRVSATRNTPSTTIDPSSCWMPMLA